jgi:hypothetical protein
MNQYFCRESLTNIAISAAVALQTWLVTILKEDFLYSSNKEL